MSATTVAPGYGSVGAGVVGWQLGVAAAAISAVGMPVPSSGARSSPIRPSLAKNRIKSPCIDNACYGWHPLAALAEMTAKSGAYRPGNLRVTSGRYLSLE
ncbi:hypothetical protein GCM10009825_33020 [Arthrobacter humicola]|uniref:Uncharacterized protein n=1 Tax=Arthrobacter humicola TaxID=409291 RepID=A0ABP5L818_9MICC